MKTSAKSFLRLVLVAGGTIAKSCPLPRAAADSSPSRSGHRRTTIAFLAKSRTRSTHSSQMAAFFPSRSRCSFRPIVVSTTFNWTWWHLSRSFISLCCWTLAVDKLSSTEYRPIGRHLATPRLARRPTAGFLWRRRRLGEVPFERWPGHASSCMTCFLLAASFRPFQRRCFPARAIPLKKKKKTDFCGPFPARGGFVRTPRTPYSYAPARTVMPVLNHFLLYLYMSIGKSSHGYCKQDLYLLSFVGRLSGKFSFSFRPPFFLSCCGEQVDILAVLRVCALLDFDIARPFTEVKKDCFWLDKEICSRTTHAESHMTKEKGAAKSELLVLA